MTTEDEIRFLRGKIAALDRDLKRLAASVAPIGALNHLSARVTELEKKSKR